MNDVIKTWIADLRENPDKQGRGRLKAGDKFCCLGRLCNLYDPNLWERDLYLGEDSALPNVVADWAGIPLNPYVGYHTWTEGLWELNDVREITFLQIADLIEKQYADT